MKHKAKDAADLSGVVEESFCDNLPLQEDSCLSRTVTPLKAQGHYPGTTREKQTLCANSRYKSNPSSAPSLTHWGLSQIDRNKSSSFPEPTKKESGEKDHHLCPLGSSREIKGEGPGGV